MVNENRKNKIDFIGIGAARSGSDWLAGCLNQHPQILFPTQKISFLIDLLGLQQRHNFQKELDFFNAAFIRRDSSLDLYSKGIDWYLDQFPAQEEGEIRGEFSPSYLVDEKAPKRIKKHFPDAKLLVILRDPTKMMHSLYYWFKAMVHTKVAPTFGEEMEKAFKKQSFLKPEYGCYHLHLQKYFQLFPEENIWVTLLQDVKNNPDEVIKDVYQFLDVDDSFQPSNLEGTANTAQKARNVFIKEYVRLLFRGLEVLHLKGTYGTLSKSDFTEALYRTVNLTPYKYPKMKAETKRKLKNYYRTDIEKLECLIKRDLGSWK